MKELISNYPFHSIQATFLSNCPKSSIIGTPGRELNNPAHQPQDKNVINHKIVSVDALQCWIITWKNYIPVGEYDGL